MKETTEKKTTDPGSVPISPELVEQAKSGDRAAFAKLYELTSAELYRSVRSMVRDEDLAWDILQDSYVRAWRGLDKLEANEAFLPWLRRIAVNVTATQMSQKRALTFTELAEDEDEGAVPDIPDLNIDNQPELALDRKETSRLVQELLAELSPEQRAVVGMHYYEDMPVKEIADTLHIKPSTVKTHLFRGRNRIEAGIRALERHGVKLLVGVVVVSLLFVGGRKLIDSMFSAHAGPVDTLPERTESWALPDTEASPVNTGSQPIEPTEHVFLKSGKCGNNLTWTLYSDGVLTIEGSGSMNDFVSNGRGLSQQDGAIPAQWSEDNRIISSVILPDGLTSIGSWAFASSFRLTAVTIPEGVTSIGPGAFYGCVSLKSALIPESVTEIGKDAFAYCEDLTIRGAAGSEAERYANENGIPFEAIP